MGIAIVGIDLGKNVCSIVEADEFGMVLRRRRVRRDKLVDHLSKLDPCIVAMEASCGAHHLAGQATGQGHEVRLMSPEYVRPYVKAQKNDERDAEAIVEAATRPTMRFVTPKSEDQLDIQALHRVRDRLVGQRTSLMNQIRGLFLERGLTTAQGRARLADFVDALLADDDAPVSSRIVMVLKDMRAEWQELDRRIKVFDAEFAAFAKSDEQAHRLVSIPGIGPLTASALVASVGDATAFAHARDLAAWIGLVPRQTTTGGKPRLGGITRRGNKYLRKNLVHGARAALPALARSQTNLGRWLSGLLTRAHPNTVVVALANRLARIAWAVLTQNRLFQPEVPARTS